jgi:glycosyltransferase involved in cell wall biosynthesis
MQGLKVLHFNQSDLVCGGACIGAYRLHQGLLDQGIDSRFLVGSATLEDEKIAVVPLKPHLEKLLFQVTFRAGLNFVNLVSSFDISKHPFYKNADILTFHNLHNGYFNYLAIPTLTRNKPAVWYLHDMWSFTGHCAFSFDCERWQHGCGRCPYPETYPYIRRDATRLEWHLKRWIYNRSNLTIITTSQWLTHKVESSLLGKFPIHKIPYGIDTTLYQPLDAQKSRRELGIPLNKKVLMCGAVSFSDPRKGGDLLIKALNKLPASLRSQSILLTMGNCADSVIDHVDMETINLGYINEDHDKAVAYSSADLFLFPSRAETFGIVAQESISCGTPVVAFNAGGVTEVVRPGITGYLAQPEDTSDFCQGIVSLLDSQKTYHDMRQLCREIAVNEYALEHQAERFTHIYSQILQNNT